MTGPDALQRFGRGVGVSLIFIAIIAASGFLNNIVIARCLGPEGRGLYAIAVSIGALALPLFGLGLNDATVFALGRGRDSGQVSGLNHLVVGLGLPVFCAIAAWAWMNREIVTLDIPLAAVAAASLALPARIYIDLARSEFLARRRIVAYNAAAAASALLLLGLNFLLLERGRDWVLIDLVMAYWAVAALLALHGGGRVKNWRWPTRLFRAQAFAYGCRAAAVQVAESALLRLDYLVIAPVVGLAQLGVYAIADQLAHILAWGSLQAGRLMLAESAHDDERGEPSWYLLSIAVRTSVGLLSVAFLLVTLSFWWVIPRVFGDAFAPAYIGLLLLLPATLFRSLHALINTYLCGQGVQKPGVYSAALAILVDLTLVLATVHLWGWFAAALARSIAWALQFAWVSRALRRRWPDRRLSYLPRRRDFGTCVKALLGR